MKSLVEILKQFNQKQKLVVLVICLLFTCTTYILTSWMKSESVNCSEVIDLNKKYVRDFVAISDLVRKQKLQMSGLNETYEDSCIVIDLGYEKISDSAITPSLETDLLDSILLITESIRK